MKRQTLEQARAQNAWERSENCDDKYVNLAKSLPALIMNSGLMQVMAFLHEKSNGRDDPHGKMGQDLRDWLHKQFEDLPTDFDQFMEHLMKVGDSRKYQDVTSEAFAWLRWLRQMAAARQNKKESGNGSRSGS